MFERLIKVVGGFARRTDGNIAIITALMAIPMLFLAGMGVDYGLASMREQQLDAYADAAALAAVTPTMMAQNTSVGVTAAKNTFNAQAGQLSDVKNLSLNVAIATAGSKRSATVSYTASYVTTFPQFLGDTMGITGTSTATGGLAPNIDFYLLLDDSPSMAIAATQAGINTMVANTSPQGGCAFGCHETHPQADNLGNPGGEDNYALARNLGVTLRIDLLRQAAQNLMSTASSTEASNHSSYRMGIYTFDHQINTLQTLTSNLTTAGTSAGNISLLTVYDNNNLTSTNNNSDTDTNYDTAFTTLNTAMPNPGSGTNTTGDTPQEVLFLVSDGVEDEMSGGSRKIQVPPLADCTTIKNRGIRIAVLYTTYLPLPTNAFYNSYVAPFQTNISPTLTSCASPGLFFQVNTGGDISAAMAALFGLAIQSSYLSQ